MQPSVLFALAALCAAPGAIAAAPHVISATEPILEAEDGILIGNGDLSVSVYQTRDQVRFRFGKCDVWDRRLDTSDDPKPPTIQEIAHGIRDEGWKGPPYGGADPVALRGTDNPERMKELCSGAPASYTRRPFPCPKPTGELALQICQDLPGLKITQALTIEEGLLRITATSTIGVEVHLTCFVPPSPNVLVVRWEVTGWNDSTRMGTGKAPVWFSLYRWADPDLTDFAQRFSADCRHDAFLSMDAAKSPPLPRPLLRIVDGRRVVEQPFPAEPTFPEGFRYLLAPFGPDLTFAPVDMSASGEARLAALPPEAATSGWIAVAVPTSTDPGGPEAELARIVPSLAPEVAAATLDTWQRDAVTDAAAFWARSAVNLGEPTLETIWYETLHARRCT
jgi:hypothetical protein